MKKIITINIDRALLGTDLQINLNTDAPAPAKVAGPATANASVNRKRDYHAAAKLINRPMTAVEGQKLLCAQLKLGETATNLRHWPRVRRYLKKVPGGFIYDEAHAATLDAPTPTATAAETDSGEYF